MKILGICGSLRKESWNLKLLKNMLEATATKGSDTSIYDLNSVPMFHPDVEAQGIPTMPRHSATPPAKPTPLSSHVPNTTDR